MNTINANLFYVFRFLTKPTRPSEIPTPAKALRAYSYIGTLFVALPVI